MSHVRVNACLSGRTGRTGRTGKAALSLTSPFTQIIAVQINSINNLTFRDHFDTIIRYERFI